MIKIKLTTTGLEIIEELFPSQALNIQSEDIVIYEETPAGNITHEYSRTILNKEAVEILKEFLERNKTND
jgi:hypothetical protein